MLKYFPLFQSILTLFYIILRRKTEKNQLIVALFFCYFKGVGYWTFLFDRRRQSIFLSD